MKNNSNDLINPVSQKGAVLIMSLILLVVLTLVGISALDATKYQMRMAANTQTINCAFQIANTGLDSLFLDYNQGNAGKDLMAFEENVWEVPKSPHEPSYINEMGHQADFQLKRVITGTGSSQNTENHYFLVESTGFCENIDPNHKAVLMEGWTRQVPPPDVTKTPKEVDLPIECYKGSGGDCPTAIGSACERAAVPPVCEVGEEPDSGCIEEARDPTEDEKVSIDDCTTKLGDAAEICDNPTACGKCEVAEPPAACEQQGGTTPT